MLTFGVTYDLKAEAMAAGMSEEAAAEFDHPSTIDGICHALSALGITPVRIGGIKSLTRRLATGERWDGVFNIAEGMNGFAREAQVPALLEAFDIPYVFSDPLTLSLALDKAMAKRIVRDAGIPTAPFAEITKPEDIERIHLPFPLFLKPSSEGSGKGVDTRSKVNSRSGLRDVAVDLLNRFSQPVLAESYLPGREFTVGITGTGVNAEVLGIAEVIPKAGFVGAGYGLANKLEGWEDKVAIEPAHDATAQDAASVALSAWNALRCRDGGRIDVRCDSTGQPSFLEVNPLAGIRPDYSDLCMIARHAGVSYDGLIAKIMTSFFVRHPELKQQLAKAA